MRAPGRRGGREVLLEGHVPPEAMTDVTEEIANIKAGAVRMTEQSAVDVVYEGLVGMESLPLKLRERRGLDRAQLATVEAALRFLTDAYADRAAVPKRLAAAFVDIQGGMEQSRAWYAEAEQAEIQNAADRLTDAAYELLGE